MPFVIPSVADAAVNVRDHGARGDGVNDDTQAFLSAIATALGSPRRATDWSPTGPRAVYLPGGTYRLRKTIRVNAGQLAFVGEGRGSSIIEQLTPDIPTFLWDVPITDGWHNSIRFAHITIRNVNVPTGKTPNQWAIRFGCGDGSPIELGGLHHALFDGLKIENQYIGIGAYRTTGSYPVWGTSFRDIWFRDIKHTAIKFDSPIGQPANVIDHCSITNYNPAVLADGPAVSAMGPLGLTIDGLNVEDWRDSILVIGGGGTVRISGLRTERHTFATEGAVACYLSGCVFTVDGTDFDSYRARHKGIAHLFRIADGGLADFRGANVTKDAKASLPGNLTAFLSDDMAADGMSPARTWGLRLGPETPLRLPAEYRNKV